MFAELCELHLSGPQSPPLTNWDPRVDVRIKVKRQLSKDPGTYAMVMETGL